VRIDSVRRVVGRLSPESLTRIQAHLFDPSLLGAFRLGVPAPPSPDATDGLGVIMP
jgi:hypothetical protein